MSLRKLFLALGLLLLVGVWGACVDVPSNPVSSPNPNFRSMVRFINVDPSGAAAGTVNVDGVTVGSIAYQAATPYADFPSGSRKVAFGGAKEQKVVIGSEQQSTVAIYKVGGELKFLNLVEGHKDKNNGNPLKAKIKFVNLAEGSAAKLFFKDTASTGGDRGDKRNLSGDIAFEAPAQYKEIDPRSISITAYSPGTYTATLSGDNEVPAAVVSKSSGSATVTMTDTGGVVYKVDVLSDNRQGFYTAAHFHLGVAGTNGNVQQAIDVTGQKMSFPSTKLDSTRVVSPASLSRASGYGTFSMTRAALTYSIDFTMAGTDTFTAAEFRGGPVGSNGSILKTIATSKFASSTQPSAPGTWTLTSGLVDSIRNGLVYVLARTQLYPNGAIRAQLVVDTATANSYSGQWKGTSLDTLRPAFNDGKMYVNFHTTANPGGQIRGQLTPTAQYSVASLPAATYEAGKMYTIIATEKGPNFKLTRLSDRLFGLSKPVSGPEVLKRTRTSK